MKIEVAKYLARCLECQEVKVEHFHSGGLLHPLSIPKWKWEFINYGFHCTFIEN